MEIKREHIKPNLLKLLEENNCVEEFLENANNPNICYGFHVFKMQNDCKYGQLAAAFSWEKTNQGGLFWLKLNNLLPDA